MLWKVTQLLTSFPSQETVKMVTKFFKENTPLPFKLGKLPKILIDLNF
jgi:hypothetical protein